MPVMCPPFNLPRTVMRPSGRRHAELFRVMQTSALPRRNIRVLRYESVSIEGTLVTTVTRPPPLTVIVLIAIAANMLMLRLGKRIAHRSKQESEQ